MTYVLALEALADPTRRALFERLQRRPHTVGELAQLARVRQPTVSQHLRVLRAADLVTDRRDGTRRFYSLRREGLDSLRQYLESFWDDVLTAYASGDPNPRPAGTTRRKPVKQGRRT